MEHPNFESEFGQAVAKWRERHGLRENDAVLLLVDLFRIHQRHWDELRRRELPSFDQFRTDIAKLIETTSSFQRQANALADLLKCQPAGARLRMVTRTAALLAALSGALAGYLFGRAFP